jgi:hypothetical protein
MSARRKAGGGEVQRVENLGGALDRDLHAQEAGHAGVP